jgi:hypothetical protein
MIQTIDSSHVTEEGVPAGGMTLATGLSIEWQNGPLVVDGERVDPNGCFVETVILAAKDRLEYYETTEFACQENKTAIADLADALRVLQSRTARREAAGVEGTHEGR